MLQFRAGRSSGQTGPARTVESVREGEQPPPPPAPAVPRLGRFPHRGLPKSAVRPVLPQVPPERIPGAGPQCSWSSPHVAAPQLRDWRAPIRSPARRDREQPEPLPAPGTGRKVGWERLGARARPAGPQGQAGRDFRRRGSRAKDQFQREPVGVLLPAVPGDRPARRLKGPPTRMPALPTGEPAENCRPAEHVPRRLRPVDPSGPRGRPGLVSRRFGPAQARTFEARPIRLRPHRSCRGMRSAGPAAKALARVPEQARAGLQVPAGKSEAQRVGKRLVRGCRWSEEAGRAPAAGRTGEAGPAGMSVAGRPDGRTAAVEPRFVGPAQIRPGERRRRPRRAGGLGRDRALHPACPRAGFVRAPGTAASPPGHRPARPGREKPESQPEGPKPRVAQPEDAPPEGHRRRPG
jgi:hypothetical protein